jgi:hypothetical protein
MHMSNQTTQINGNIWKLGRSGNIEFCGNFVKLREKEPKVAALLLGHEQQEGYETEDSEYRYKVYHSQYGYSVGRRKKPVFIPDSQPPLTISHKGIVTGGNESKSIEITPTETTQKTELVTDSLSFTSGEIRILKELAAAISELITMQRSKKTPKVKQG